MYSNEEVLEKQRLARQLRLAGAALLDDVEAVQRDCNGIGAAWMPEWTRDVIGCLYPELEIVADIHDRRYAVGGGITDRWKADFEFFCNAVRVALRLPGLTRKRRRRLLRTSLRLYVVLILGGATAFNYRKGGACGG